MDGHQDVDVLLLSRDEDHVRLGRVVAVTAQRDAVLAGLHRELGGHVADRLAVDRDRGAGHRRRDTQQGLGGARGEHDVDRLDLPGLEGNLPLEREVVAVRDGERLRAGVHAEDRLTGLGAAEDLVAEADLRAGDRRADVIVAMRLRTSLTRSSSFGTRAFSSGGAFSVNLEGVERLRKLGEPLVCAAHVVEEGGVLRRLEGAPVIGEGLLVAEGDHRYVTAALVLVRAAAGRGAVTARPAPTRDAERQRSMTNARRNRQRPKQQAIRAKKP